MTSGAGAYGTYCQKCGNEGPPCACPANSVPVESAPAPDPLASALKKLRSQAAAPSWPVPAQVTSQEAAALLAKLEAAGEIAPVSGKAAAPVGVRRYIGQMSYRGEIVSGLDSWVRAADHQAALAAAQQRIAELREQVSAAKELAEMAADVHERMSELNIDFAPGDQIALQFLHHATAKFAAVANPPQDRKEQS